jgi:hypothetical protein
LAEVELLLSQDNIPVEQPTKFDLVVNRQGDQPGDPDLLWCMSLVLADCVAKVFLLP